MVYYQTRRGTTRTTNNLFVVFVFSEKDQSWEILRRFGKRTYCSPFLLAPFLKTSDLKCKEVKLELFSNLLVPFMKLGGCALQVLQCM